MSKMAQRYLDVNPWQIIETGFHKERSRVSESLFSLANEYSGIRGVFDEGSSLPSLRGSYFNGIYEYAKEDTPMSYRGIVKRTHFMINSVDWIKVKIQVKGHTLDLGRDDFKDFKRILDLRSGLLTREFVWLVEPGLNIALKFSRFLSMEKCHQAYQRIEITANQDMSVNIDFSLDSKVLHWGHDCFYKPLENVKHGAMVGTINGTLTTKQKVASFMQIDLPEVGQYVSKDRAVSLKYELALHKDTKKTITRYVVNLADKASEHSIKKLASLAIAELTESVAEGYEKALEDNKKYWAGVWAKSDILIEGDDLNQQGIRFTIFQLEQTYHGFDPHNNIGAKGLTGEAYSGHAFWDSETYCLPFYLFNNPEAAKNLLMFRYFTLPQAVERSAMLDCVGACYPIATLNGKEGCNLWQHASLQFQPSPGVAYGIYHYVQVTHDTDFLLNYGLEMLLQISRFLLSRGQWNQDGSHFGYYGVMGPDEFEMMVNHNTYTNIMAKKTFEYTLGVIAAHSKDPKVAAALAKTGVDAKTLEAFKVAADKMLILYNPKTKIFEEHQGFFDLPHIDPDAIPVEEFPLYAHWSYDRIYRNDLVKQPDVLMFMFLYSGAFSLQEKKANYEYYEPKCIHESSLSPSIHSIFASELGKEKEALDFFGFATRMDLDDYNRNALEGLHTTSIAAAWMNIVYGYGGLRSDGPVLSLNPTIPAIWHRYEFKFTYQGALVNVEVSKDAVKLTNAAKTGIDLLVYGKPYHLADALKIAR